jgi:xanthine dehydrogenase YagS FAD-binding subunit
MQAFSYTRAADVDAAIRSAQAPGAMFLGGGTNLLDLAKGNITHPVALIDVTRLPLDAIRETPDGGLSIGATARNSDTANHPLVRTRYPLLSQALLAGASPQLRNMATIGGNLMQRTRCYYFADAGFAMCNKRNPGSGCAALNGPNRIHAVLGASEQCIATNPSDMNVALAALEAVVRVRGPRGERRIAFADFHRLPGEHPERDTTLEPGELILAVELPPNNFAAHSNYLKVRDRASYAFALVSVAAALDIQNGAIRKARIAMGGVAHKPWRVAEAEQMLVGKAPSRELFTAASVSAMRGARAYRDNAFKVALGQRAIVRALETSSGGAA